MRIFNAFQLAILMCAWPFIIHWFETANVWGGTAFYWAAIVAFVFQFGYTVYAYAESFGA